MKRLVLLVWAVALVAAAPALAQQNPVTINFELAVEGEPPADATFFGQYLVERATVQLTDPDGDGVYTGSMSGGAPEAGFRIVQGTGAEQTMTGVHPGKPVSVIEEFDAPPSREARRRSLPASPSAAVGPGAEGTRPGAATGARPSRRRA